MSKKFLFVDSDGNYEETPGAYEQTDFINSSAGVGDAGKPIVLNASGVIDSTMVDASSVDHGGLSGLADDDHSQYLLADGTRDITGIIAYNASKTFTDDAQLVDKKYVDDRIAGLDPKASSKYATTTALDAYTPAGSGVGKTLTADANGALSIDGNSPAVDDRILVKDENSGGAHVDHGIYTVTATGDAGNPWVLTRATDFDGSPAGEVTHGGYTFVMEGTANEDTGWIMITSDPITVDTTAMDWQQYQGTGTYTASYGIEFAGTTGKDIRMDLLAAGGLAIESGEAYVNVDDIDGDGLTTSGTAPNKDLDIDWATTFTIDGADAKAFKASDLASTSGSAGASIVGVQDTSAYYTGTDLETVLNEIEAQIGGSTSTTYGFSEDNVLADNDALYAALNKLDLKWGDLASSADGEGANIVGVESSDTYWTGTDLMTVLDEVKTQLGATSSTAYGFTEDNVLADDDAVYAALNKLDLKWGDLASTANGEGAALVSIEDAGGYTDETTVEASLQEIYNKLQNFGPEYTAGTGGVTKGDLVYVSANDTILPLPITGVGANNFGIGLVLADAAAAATTTTLANDTVLTNVLSTATAGDKYYWNGTSLTNTIPNSGGAYVWRVGVAKNATDLHVDVEFVKKNSA